MKRVVSIVLAVFLIALSAMPAFAKVSPEKSDEYNLIIHNTNGGSGTYTAEVDKDGKHCTLVAHPKNGYTFTHWVIKGKYGIDEGTLKDDSLTIVLKGDCEAWPYFKSNNKSEQSEPSKPVSRNSSTVSPKTGDNGSGMYFGFIALATLVAVCGAVGVKAYSTKKK